MAATQQDCATVPLWPGIGAVGVGVGSQLDHLLEPVRDRALKVFRRDARSSVASLATVWMRIQPPILGLSPHRYRI